MRIQRKWEIKSAAVEDKGVESDPAPQQAPPPARIEEIDRVVVGKLSDTITCLQCRSKRNVIFKMEIEYRQKRGSAMNSYLLQGDKGTVLIDVPDKAYSEIYVKALEEQFDLSTLSCVILTSINPTAIPTLASVLTKATQGQRSARLRIVLSNPALQLVQKIFGEKEETAKLLSDIDFEGATPETQVKYGSSIDLQFILAPTPRWPDICMVYDAASRIIFSSRFFSAHVTPLSTVVWDVAGWPEYSKDWKYFCDCTMGVMAKQANAAMQKLDLMTVPTDAAGAVIKRFVQFLLNSKTASKRSVSRIAPRYGPVIVSSVNQILFDYKLWLKEFLEQEDRVRVAVMYASAYGNTAAIAQAISRGAVKAGVGVRTLNLEICTLDELKSQIRGCKGFAIGSPTLGGHMPTQVSAALGAILAEQDAKQMPCGVFGSFGWSGEAVDEMNTKLSNAGFSFAFPAIKVKFAPTAKSIQTAEESGTDLAQKVLGVEKQVQRQLSSAPQQTATEAEKALGRVIGSMCVITAKEDDSRSGMLASWISQASFNPPGMTMAVKQDRAMESLLTNGSSFLCNIIPEDKMRDISKAMLKKFGPGEDRFQDLNVEEDELTGAPILADCASYLQCEVVSKMVTGDHIVVYAQVKGGKVLRDKVLSAVHHRKIGTQY